MAEMEVEDNNELAIGAYEAAFCMDAAVTFVYEMCENIIDRLRYAGTYCDDGLAVDELVHSEFFQFTAELWKPPGNNEVPTKEETQEEEEMLDGEWKKWEERVTVILKQHFPYLDMKMHWEGKNLRFLVYNKENKTIKYVNKESCHRRAVF
eukprot:7729441-Ditylum_brightwellii.AAC.1